MFTLHLKLAKIEKVNLRASYGWMENGNEAAWEFRECVWRGGTEGQTVTLSYS